MGLLAFKGRVLHEGDVVQVYRNLHKGAFSLRSKKTGLVLAHGDNFRVNQALPIVKEHIRQKVLQTKVRNVHAYLEGVYVGEIQEPLGTMSQVYYSPFVSGDFLQDGEPFIRGDVFFLQNIVYTTMEKKEVFE